MAGSAVIGALRVNLGIDTAAFSDGLAKAKKGLKGFGESMTRAGQTLSIGLTAPLTALGVKSVAAFGKQEKAVAAVEAAVKATGGAAGFTTAELGKMASELQNVSTFGDEDILNKVTANLLTFTNIQGEVFANAQQAALDLSARLGQDLQSSAIQLGKALNDPINGITALSRVGVAFTEQQKTMIRTMVEAGDTAGAQGLILEELARQYGGQAAAMAATTSGQMTQAMNALGDATEAVGAVIAQYIPPIAQAIKSMAESFQALSPETQKFIVVAAGIAAALGPVLIAVGLLATGVAAIGAPVAAVIAGIAALTAGIVAFWPEIKRAAEAVANFVSELTQMLAQVLVDGFNQMAEIGGQFITGLLEGMKAKAAAVKDWLVNTANGWVSNIKSVFQIRSPSRVMFGIGEDIMSGLLNGIDQAAPTVRQMAETIGGTLVDTFTDIVTGTRKAKDALIDLGRQILRMLANRMIADLLGALLGGTGGVGAPINLLSSTASAATAAMASGATMNGSGYTDARRITINAPGATAETVESLRSMVRQELGDYDRQSLDRHVTNHTLAKRRGFVK